MASSSWLLDDAAFRTADGSTEVPRGELGPFDFADQRTYYYLCVATVVAVAGLLAALRRTGVGRTIVAVRENESAASAASVPPARVKLAAFALSGAVAGVAGALYGGLFVTVRVADFGPDRSLSVLTMVVIGGVGFGRWRCAGCPVPGWTAGPVGLRQRGDAAHQWRAGYSSFCSTRGVVWWSSCSVSATG